MFSYYFGSSYASLCASASRDDVMCYSPYPTRDHSIESAVLGDGAITDLTLYLDLTISAPAGTSHSHSRTYSSNMYMAERMQIHLYSHKFCRKFHAKHKLSPMLSTPQPCSMTSLMHHSDAGLHAVTQTSLVDFPISQEVTRPVTSTTMIRTCTRCTLTPCLTSSIRRGTCVVTPR